MKTFRRTYRPEEIKYNGEIYTPNDTISGAMAARTAGKKAVIVEVLSSRLKGKTDLHGKPYEPTKHIYTT